MCDVITTPDSGPDFHLVAQPGRTSLAEQLLPEHPHMDLQDSEDVRSLSAAKSGQQVTVGKCLSRGSDVIQCLYVESDISQSLSRDSDVIQCHGPDLGQCLSSESDVRQYLSRDSYVRKCLPRGSDVIKCLYDESDISQSLSRHSNVRHCLSNEPEICQYVSRDSDISQCLNRGLDPRQCLSPDSGISQYLYRGPDPRQCLSRDSGVRQCLSTTSERGQCVSNESDMSLYCVPDIRQCLSPDSDIKQNLSHVPDIRQVNNRGQTSLILAVMSGDTELVKKLHRQGSSLSHTDEFGLDAILYAVKFHHHDLLDYLLRHTAQQQHTWGHVPRQSALHLAADTAGRTTGKLNLKPSGLYWSQMR